MANPHGPTTEQRQAFVQRMKQFRDSLDTDEQRMFDAVINSARKAHEQGDVQVYWMTGYPSNNPPGTDLTIGTPGSAWWTAIG